MIIDVRPGTIVRLDARRSTSSIGGAYDVSDLSPADLDRLLATEGVELVENRHPGPDLPPDPDAVRFAHKNARELFEHEKLTAEIVAASGVTPSSESGLTTGDVRDVLAYRDKHTSEEP